MAIGVEKVGLKKPDDENILRNLKVKYPQNVTIKAEEKILIEAFYFENTPPEKRGRAKWVAQPNTDIPYTTADGSGVIGDVVEISVPKKFCGPQQMAVEAFISSPTNKYPAKILVWGSTQEKITKITWSKIKGGSDLGSERIKFGDHLWLNLQTEGCSGSKIKVEIYHQEAGSDPYVDSTYYAKCYSGEVNLHIKDTYNWSKKRGFIDGEEEYYAKIKVYGAPGYLTQKSKLTLFKDEVSSKEIFQSEAARPLKLDQNEINIERYETCRFKKISFEDDGKQIEVFNEKKLKLGGEEKKEFAITKVINFDLDDGNLRADAKIILDELAIFLNKNPFIPVELGAHCDKRADDEYNDGLSNDRAKSSVDYLLEKGVAIQRISAKGYGKRRLLINGKKMSEAQHQLNRRVTIKYRFDGTGAIVYQTVVPNKTGSVPRKIKLKVEGLESTEHCFRKNNELKHTDDVIIIDPDGNKIEKKGTSDILQHIYSPTSSWLPLAPLNYILPHLVDPNIYTFYINSCRYYPNKKNKTIVISAYTDIRWDFHLYLNLNNSLALKWQNVTKARQKELFSKAGSMGGNAGNKQEDISFGALFQAQWNKTEKEVPKVSEAKYDEKKEYTKNYDAKLKKFYSIFAKVREASKLIAGGTKSKVAKTVNKKLPLEVEIMPPTFRLGANWELARGYKNNKPTNEVGTLVKFYLQADPLVGMELTLDLLRTALGSAGPAGVIANELRDWLKPKKDDKRPFTLDVYVNLIVFGIIKIPEISLQYNTASDQTDENNRIKADAEATVGLTLEAGILIKAKVALVIAEFYFNAEATVEGTGSITFGHALTYQNETLYYRPALRFDGLNAKVVAKAEIGITIKKHWPGWSKDLVDHEREYENIIEPFDIIKKIEESTGLNADFAILGENKK